MTLIFELFFRLYNRLSIKYELRLYKGEGHMNISIIAVGSELLLGQIANTNANIYQNFSIKLERI